MADAEWEAYRAEIERLYIQQDKTLLQVISEMGSQHNFHKSKSQYERKFRKWGVRKYQMNAEKWKFIGRRAEKRKREFEKETDVFFDGTHYPASKVRKETSRPENYVSTLDQLRAGASPRTPDGIVVFTPGTPGTAATPGMEVAGDNSLPWFRFLAVTRPGNSQGGISLSSTMLSAPGNAYPSPNTGEGLVGILDTIIPSGEPENGLQSQPSRSRTTSVLGILMPEEHEGRHSVTSAVLHNPKCPSLERLKVELFLLSNNFMFHGPSDSKSKEHLRPHDERLMQTFQQSGLNDIQHIRILVNMPEATAGAIAEKLFKSALRLHNLELVARMLDAGMDPNLRFDTPTLYRRTPLQYAAGLEDLKLAVEMANILLLHQADVNLSRDQRSALYYSVRGRNKELTQILLGAGANPTPLCLAAVVSLGDRECIETLLKAGVDVNQKFEWTFTDTQRVWGTALGLAVWDADPTIVELLLEHGADPSELEDVEFEDRKMKTSAYGLAARQAEVGILSLLLENRTYVELSKFSQSYVWPLALAVGWDGVESVTAQLRRAETVKALLNAGASVAWADVCGEMTLLERAARNDDLELCRVLIEHGAKIEQPFQADRPNYSALFIAAERKNIGIVRLLLGCHARVNDTYTQSPGTALGAAIEVGDIAMIQNLQFCGAINIGRHLRKIGNVETAQLLEAMGLLKGILEAWGSEILANSIEGRSLVLTQYLLNYDIGDYNTAYFNNQLESGNLTPLEAAISTGDKNIARVLLSRIAHVNEQEICAAVSDALRTNEMDILNTLLARFHGSAPTALTMAIYAYDVEMIETLLQGGVDPRGRPFTLDGSYDTRYCWHGNPDEHGPYSVLELAAARDDMPIFQCILNATHWAPELTGRALVRAIHLRHDPIVHELLEAGADVNQDVMQEDGQWVLTPLQAAVQRQLVPLVKRLLEAGADVSYLGEGSHRRTALQIAVQKGNKELISILLEAGADVNGPPAKDGGATALQIAAIQGFFGIARKLIKLGADINAGRAMTNGRTALEGAAEHGRLDMLEFLLRKGAFIEDRYVWQYNRAISLAYGNGHMAAARLLMRFKQGIPSNEFHDDSDESDEGFVAEGGVIGSSVTDIFWIAFFSNL